MKRYILYFVSFLMIGSLAFAGPVVTRGGGGGAGGAHEADHIDGGADVVDGDKIELTWTPDVITPDAGIAEADSTDDLAAILEGIEDFFTGLSAVYQPLDADLTDLADGSLSGSKVGSGFDLDNAANDTTDDDLLDASQIGPFGAVNIDAQPDSDDTYGGIIYSTINAGEAVAQWEVVYLDATSNEYMLADADAAGEFPAYWMAVEACTDGNPCKVLKLGLVRNDGWTWTTKGARLFLSDTPGALTETAPSTTGDCIQVMAVVMLSVAEGDAVDVIDFSPSMDYATAQ